MDPVTVTSIKSWLFYKYINLVIINYKIIFKKICRVSSGVAFDSTTVTNFL